MSIEELNKNLVSGDKVWIARQMPGKFYSNKVQVSKLLNGKLKGRGKVNGLILELAHKRAGMNIKLLSELSNIDNSGASLTHKNILKSQIL